MNNFAPFFPFPAVSSSSTGSGTAAFSFTGSFGTLKTGLNRQMK